MSWPYISYCGLQNELTLLSVFNQDVINRIQIVPPTIEIRICETYITETRDLFVIVYKYIEHKYFLYMLDLDLCNTMEIDKENIPEIEKAFNFKKEKFCYSEEDVEFKDFTQIHIRGDSRKEPINFRESLMVFILHEDKIY